MLLAYNGMISTKFAKDNGGHVLKHALGHVEVSGRGSGHV